MSRASLTTAFVAAMVATGLVLLPAAAGASAAAAPSPARPDPGSAGVSASVLLSRATSNPTGSGFPVTIATPAGKVTITSRPRRVVSLSPSATEDLFAIGAGKQVVAVDDDSNYPPGAPRTSLSGYTPDVEAIARYRPDLVVISFEPALVATLGKLGIPVLYQDAPSTVAGAEADVTELGKATGDRAHAARLVASMRHQLTALAAKAPHLVHPPSYYVELDSSLYSATSRTLIGSVFALFGLRDIADGAAGAAGGYPQLSEEYVVKADPQLIFLADTGSDGGQTPATVARRPGWGTIAAVADHHIVALDADIASRWGPRLVDLAAAVETALATDERQG
jgi:iron complex transport system substrate-binding protein